MYSFILKQRDDAQIYYKIYHYHGLYFMHQMLAFFKFQNVLGYSSGS